MPLMVSVSGIRGVVGEDLTPPVLINFIESYINFLGKKQGTILIGRDSRESGKFIERIVEGTVNALGYDVINIGIATTPTVLLMTRKLSCDGGIAVTASHNPSQWNALKFCDEKGLFLKEESIEKIKNRVNNPDRSSGNWGRFDCLGATRFESNAGLVHIDEVLQRIDHVLIKQKKLKVAIDPAGASGSVIDRTFLEKLGCTVIGINETPEPQFPRGPEPVPENISDLCNLVKSHKADIGFAQDPDGDRLAVVAETGAAIGEEYTLVLAGEAYLHRKKTDVACNLSTSMMIDDLARRFGVNVHRTKIGEINVTDKLLKDNLFFGGEGNGGVIVPEINPCRDSVAAMGLILELLATSGKTVTRIIGEFPSYIIKKVKKPVIEKRNEDLYQNIYEKVKISFSDYIINTIDGIKIYNNSEWFHIRLSNTEPVMRIIAESRTESRTDELIDIFNTMLDQL